jgi:hypothetical protein
MKQDSPTTVKVAAHSKYKPKEMTDASVFDLAQHYYTFQEICEYFNVTSQTLEAHHGEAFREGKQNAMQKPRMLLNRILQDFANLEVGTLARNDVPTGTLLKAIELHAKKYEGMGSTQTVISKTESPSVSDIKFSPLTKEDV